MTRGSLRRERIGFRNERAPRARADSRCESKMVISFVVVFVVVFLVALLRHGVPQEGTSFTQRSLFFWTTSLLPRCGLCKLWVQT